MSFLHPFKKLGIGRHLYSRKAVGENRNGVGVKKGGRALWSEFEGGSSAVNMRTFQKNRHQESPKNETFCDSHEITLLDEVTIDIYGGS
jgi:hypothetical protein